MKLFDFYPADRSMAIANIKVSWQRAIRGIDYQKGRDSGYPICCNAWFHIRIFSMYAWIFAFKNYGWFHDPRPLEFQQKKRYTQHVCCPLHKFLYRNGRGVSYQTCTGCGWQQLNSQRCNLCGSFMVTLCSAKVADKASLASRLRTSRQFASLTKKEGTDGTTVQQS